MLKYILIMSCIALFHVSAQTQDSDPITKLIEAQPSEKKSYFVDRNRLAQEDSVIYKGVRIRAFRYAIAIEKEGKAEIIYLKKEAPHTKPGGAITRYYKKQGGKKVFGKPLEGVFQVCDNRFRLHVFEKGIIIKKTKKRGEPVSLIFDKPFHW